MNIITSKRRDGAGDEADQRGSFRCWRGVRRQHSSAENLYCRQQSQLCRDSGVASRWENGNRTRESGKEGKLNPEAELAHERGR